MIYPDGKMEIIEYKMETVFYTQFEQLTNVITFDIYKDNVFNYGAL